MLISIEEICGENTVTRKDGKIMKTYIKNIWDKEEKITIDFNNRLVASVSFFDEAFGKLAFEYPKTKLKEKLSFINIKEYDRALLNDILIYRYKHQN